MGYQGCRGVGVKGKDENRMKIFKILSDVTSF